MATISASAKINDYCEVTLHTLMLSLLQFTYLMSFPVKKNTTLTLATVQLLKTCTHMHVYDHALWSYM